MGQDSEPSAVRWGPRFEGVDRVCLVGFCETSREYAPWGDRSWAIWSLNRGYIFARRANRWFDMHSPTIRGWAHRRPGHHLRWLQSFPGPVYLHEEDPEIPNSVRFPLEEVAADVGAGLYRLFPLKGEVAERAAWPYRVEDAREEPYFDSSIAYMIALAIHEGFREIMLAGIDLNTQSEYVWQRSGVSWLLGVAMGRGIRVLLPEPCPLLRGPLYGRGYLSAEGEHMSKEQLESRLEALRLELENARRELWTLEGAKQELEQFTLAQMVPGIDHEVADRRRRQMDAAIAEHQARLIRAEGALKETLYWIHQTPGGQDPKELARQGLEQDLHGYRPSLGEQLSEGDLTAYAMVDEPPAPVAQGNGTGRARAGRRG